MMRRILLTLTSLVLVLPLIKAQYRQAPYASLTDSETVTAFKESVSFLASAYLDGRAAGSEGEKEAAAYLSHALESAGATLLSGKDGDVFGLKRENGDTLTSRNVVAFIPGYDRELRERYIVIGARMDNLGSRDITVNGQKVHKIFYGAGGNASGMAMLLELARRLSTNSVLLRRSVLLIGFGSSLETHAGAWYFLNRSFPDVDRIDAMINLDMLGTGTGGFYAYTGSNRDMNAMLEALSSTLQPVKPEIVAIEPCPSDHRAFYDKEIPSVFFTSGRYREYMTDKDTPEILQYAEMERETEYIFNFAVSLSGGPAPVFNPEKELRSRAQDESSTRTVPYYDCDRRPLFLGSGDPRVFLEKWVYQYLRYPAEAVREGRQGRVLVDFVIDEKGKVTDVKVLRGVHELLDAEAVRVISASPDWKPGILGGKKVRAEMSMYVEFRLEKKK
ncbi:MAG: TonB family protein [Bacteroidales bacterium]|nr:TonB family protein [Bacteroidales bacterium]